ncbi:MAG: Hpt domain-containing protein, partial [Planctomycetota bacterium]
MADAEIIKAFVVESLDLLDEVEPRLVELEQAASEAGQMDAEAVNSVFRLFHSMKGSAGCLQLTSISHLTHEAETLLDLYRKGKAVMRAEHTSALFRSMDLIRSMLEHVDAEMNDQGFDDRVNELAGELKTIIEQETGVSGQAPTVKASAPVVSAPPVVSGCSEEVTPEIR